MEEVVDASEILATSNLVVEGHVTSTSISSKGYRRYYEYTRI